MCVSPLLISRPVWRTLGSASKTNLALLLAHCIVCTFSHSTGGWGIANGKLHTVGPAADVTTAAVSTAAVTSTAIATTAVSTATVSTATVSTGAVTTAMLSLSHGG